jgi:hypothetical protein
MLLVQSTIFEEKPHQSFGVQLVGQMWELVF